jgi:lipase chaperone LimK
MQSVMPFSVNKPTNCLSAVIQSSRSIQVLIIALLAAHVGKAKCSRQLLLGPHNAHRLSPVDVAVLTNLAIAN